MAEQEKTDAAPRGFADGVRGLAGEYAHEQGWELDEAERSKPSDDPNLAGGGEYNYGARDVGDEAVKEEADGKAPVRDAGNGDDSEHVGGEADQTKQQEGLE